MTQENAMRFVAAELPDAQIHEADAGQRLTVRWPGERTAISPSLLHVSESDLRRWARQLQASRDRARV